MIAALPVTASVSATDNTLSTSAAVVRAVRYPLAVYSLSPIYQTRSRAVSILRLSAQESIFYKSAHSITKGLLTGSFFEHLKLLLSCKLLLNLKLLMSLNSSGF